MNKSLLKGLGGFFFLFLLGIIIYFYFNNKRWEGTPPTQEGLNSSQTDAISNLLLTLLYFISISKTDTQQEKLRLLQMIQMQVSKASSTLGNNKSVTDLLNEISSIIHDKNKNANAKIVGLKAFIENKIRT